MSGDTPTALAMRGVRKTFGGVVALAGVDLEVARGEVHALIGENGAGKSTLMKVLSGAHQPDEGEMQLDGAPYRPGGPQEALARGVAMIYQELNLAPHLSVEQNILLGRESSRLGWIEHSESRPAVRRALEWLGLEDLPLGRRVSELGPGTRQLVEVARALVGDVRVLVLDEPTSSLSRADTERLFDIIRRLRDRGVSIVYISHFLEEVREVADRYTVLRDGQTVARGRVEDATIATLIEQMVGRDLDEVYPKVPHEPGEVLLRVEGLCAAGADVPANLEVRRGEILGIAGLVGAGRTELLRALFGLEDVRAGSVHIGSATLSPPDPGRSLSNGMGLLAEDRKEEGLALGLSISVNATLSQLEPFTRAGWVSSRDQQRAAQHWIERLNIRCSGPGQAAGELSGGNQQKIALARLLHHDVDVWLLDEPTRGVDVESKVEIYRLMGELAARGKALLVVSSYLPELLGVCDRIAVMHRGALGAPRPTSEWTETALLDEAARGAKAGAL